jgi:ATP-dependent Clp protease protease subunit
MVLGVAPRQGSAMNPSPLVMDGSGNSERSEVSSHPLVSTRTEAQLFALRTVLLFGEITSTIAERVTTLLLALAAESDDPIRMLVHSPGGHVEAADAIHDVVRFIRPEVRMIGTGWVASAGALVFVAARPECRFALPNTRFLLHQPLGGVAGVASDVEIEARQILLARERVNRIFARETKQPYDKIVRDTQRNHWMNAGEACAYGLVARVVERCDDV